MTTSEFNQLEDSMLLLASEYSAISKSLTKEKPNLWQTLHHALRLGTLLKDHQDLIVKLHGESDGV